MSRPEAASATSSESLGPVLSTDQLFKLGCIRASTCTTSCPRPDYSESICNNLRAGIDRHARESAMLGLSRPALVLHDHPSSCVPRHQCRRLGPVPAANRLAQYVLARAAADAAGLTFVDARPACARASDAVQLLPAIVQPRQRDDDSRAAFATATTIACDGDPETSAQPSTAWMSAADTIHVELRQGLQTYWQSEQAQRRSHRNEPRRPARRTRAHGQGAGEAVLDDVVIGFDCGDARRHPRRSAPPPTPAG